MGASADQSMLVYDDEVGYYTSHSPSAVRALIDAQPSSAKLTALAGLAVTDGNIIVGDGEKWVAETGATARASLGVYSTTEVNNKIVNKPDIYYNTETAVSGALIIADVVAVA